MTDSSQLQLEDGPRWFRGYGWYEDSYVRTAQGWRISRSVFTRFDMDPMPIA